MKQAFSTLCVAAAAWLALTSPALAQSGGLGGIHFSNALGAGIVILGASWGIGRIGQAALDNMARQPEIADKIQGAMIVAAALIEGATLFALIVCIITTSAPYKQ